VALSGRGAGIVGWIDAVSHHQRFFRDRGMSAHGLVQEPLRGETDQVGAIVQSRLGSDDAARNIAEPA